MSKDNDPEDTEYEVDKILKVRINPKNNKREFLVKWQHWKEEDSTWEPEKHLENVRDLIEEFMDKQPKTMPTPSQGLTEAIQKKQQLASPIKEKRSIPLNESLDHKSTLSENLPENRDRKINPLSSADFKDNTQKLDSSANMKLLSADSSSPSDYKPRKRGRPRKIRLEGGEDSTEKKEKATLGCRVPSNFMSEQQWEPAPNNDDPMVFEAIDGIRKISTGTEFLVRFQNNPSAMWVNENDLEDFQEEIKEFLAKTSKSQSSITASTTNSRVITSKGQADKNRDTTDTNKPSKDKNFPSKEQPIQNNIFSSNLPSKSKEFESKQPYGSRCGTQVILDDGEYHFSQSSKEKGEINIQNDYKEYKSNNSHHLDKKHFFEGQNSHSRQGYQQSHHTPKKHQFARRTGTTEDSDILGDFKTDNVDSIEILGDYRQLMSCRVEVTWIEKESKESQNLQQYFYKFNKKTLF